MNAALREHVTSHGFVLTLAKTQIAMLEALANQREGSSRFFIPATRGLIERGLIEHRPSVGEPLTMGNLHLCYPLTRAGELVFELLVESGLAQRLQSESAAA